MQVKIYARNRFAQQTDAYIYQGSMQLDCNFSEGIDDLKNNVSKSFGIEGMQICVVFPDEGFVYTF